MTQIFVVVGKEGGQVGRESNVEINEKARVDCDELARKGWISGTKMKGEHLELSDSRMVRLKNDGGDGIFNWDKENKNAAGNVWSKLKTLS